MGAQEEAMRLVVFFLWLEEKAVMPGTGVRMRLILLPIPMPMRSALYRRGGSCA